VAAFYGAGGHAKSTVWRRVKALVWQSYMKPVA
jgi:hypothetical protein